MASSAGARPSGSSRPLLALAIVIAALPLALPNNYTYEVAILVGLNAIVCVGLNLLIGYAGQISLGHAGFFGLGAYGSAILAARYGWPAFVSIPVASRGWTARLGHRAADPAPEGPCARDGDARLRHHRLDRARHRGPPHRRADGMAVPGLNVFGYSLSGERSWYWLVGAALVGAVWLART